MTDDEIRQALVTLKQRAIVVPANALTAEQHVGLIELIIDAEAILRGFPPRRPRAEIEHDIEQAINDR